MVEKQGMLFYTALSAMRLPAINRVFPFENSMNFFEALFTCFPVFVAGIRHFHHDPALFGYPQRVTSADQPRIAPKP